VTCHLMVCKGMQVTLGFLIWNDVMLCNVQRFLYFSCDVTEFLFSLHLFICSTDIAVKFTARM